MVYDVGGNVVSTIYDYVGETVPTGYDDGGEVVIDDDTYDYTETFVQVNASMINDTKTGYYISKETDIKNMPLDYSGYEFNCTYSTGAVFGVFLSGTLAYFDGSVLKVYKTFTQNNSEVDLPADSDIMFQQACVLTNGETYTIKMTRKSFNVVIEVNDVTYSAYLAKAGSAWSNTSRISEFGYAVFSGSIYAISTKSYMPYFGEHVRCAIFGDSITEGIGTIENDPSDYNKRYAWQLCKNFYDYDCVTCGVGGANANSAWLRFQNLIAAGYTFDDVIYYVGTNDGIEQDGIADLTAKMQSIVDGTKAEGCRVFWCIMPVATNARINNARTASLAVTGAEAVIDFANVLPAAGAIHPDSAGQTLMYEEALSVLAEHID